MCQKNWEAVLEWRHNGRAVEVIEEHKVEQPLYFDLISIQTRPYSDHDEQDIKN
jgi:hypothetical protein